MNPEPEQANRCDVARSVVPILRAVVAAYVQSAVFDLLELL